LGIAGLVIGTAAANIVMTWLQLRRLRTGFNGHLEGGQTLMITARILVATAITAALAWAVWTLLDHLLGQSLPAQILAVGISCIAALVLYARLVLTMRVPEANQIKSLVVARLRSSGATR
jgi:peptidoglycan biosynthesis protein MviN/MurJ (putative lipid II flippase)